jgi:flagellar hook-basal body complex protein FliE
MSTYAIQAYQQTQNLHKMDAIPALSKEPVDSLSFQDVLLVGRDAITQSHEAEKVALEGVKGKADPLSVVTSLNTAEATLQAVTTIVSKSIQTINEVKNMPL